VYEILIEQWKLLRVTIPELAHYIDVGIAKLEEYIGQARKTRIYAHAMGKYLSSQLEAWLITLMGNSTAVNPSMKFEWMTKHWLDEEVDQAREWVKESVSPKTDV
jgi:hypothetical protein